MKITKKQLRCLIKESILQEEAFSADQAEAFFNYAEQTQEELKSILELYDKFLDKAEEHAKNLGYSNDAPRDFIKGRLQDIVNKFEKLPIA